MRPQGAAIGRRIRQRDGAGTVARQLARGDVRKSTGSTRAEQAMWSPDKQWLGGGASWRAIRGSSLLELVPPDR
jgi:hypothetical protein